MNRTRTSSLCAVVALTVVALAGCSSDGDEASTCKDLQALAADVRTLADVDLSAGSEGLSDDIDQVDQAWEQAKESAGDQFGSELDALEMAMDDLSSTFAEVGDTGVGDSLTALQQNLTAVSDAWSALADAVDSELGDCDLSAS